LRDVGTIGQMLAQYGFELFERIEQLQQRHVEVLGSHQHAFVQGMRLTLNRIGITGFFRPRVDLLPYNGQK